MPEPNPYALTLDPYAEIQKLKQENVELKHWLELREKAEDRHHMVLRDTMAESFYWQHVCASHGPYVAWDQVGRTEKSFWLQIAGDHV